LADAVGRVTRWPLGGANGIVDAVLVDSRRIADDAGLPVSGQSVCGDVIFRDARSRSVLRIVLDEWLPEFSDVLVTSAGHPDPLRCLALTGIADLLKEAGLPCRVVKKTNDEALIKLADFDSVPIAMPGRYSLMIPIAVRLSLLIVVVAGLFGSLIVHDEHAWWPLLAAVGIAVTAAFDVGLLVPSVVRDQRTRPVLIVWRPQPCISVSRRFLKSAQLAATDEALVVTSLTGMERWLPRFGPRAVVALVRVDDAIDGLGDVGSRLELRTADGAVRAALPWNEWFGGASNDDVSQLAGRLGLAFEPSGAEVKGMLVTTLSYRGTSNAYGSGGAAAWVFETNHPVAVFAVLALICNVGRHQLWWGIGIAVGTLAVSGGRVVVRAAWRRWWSGHLVRPAKATLQLVTATS
jgi:hypothetical protein